MINRTLAWIAAGALAALPAFAGPGRPHGPGPGHPEWTEERLEMRAERVADALELSAEQRANFERLRADALAAAEPMRDQMRAGHEQLRALLDGANPDAAEVGAKAIEIHRLRGELAAAREKLDRDFEATLTDAQKLAWKALRETRPGAHLRERFGHAGAGPGPFGPPPVD